MTQSELDRLLAASKPLPQGGVVIDPSREKFLMRAADDVIQADLRPEGTTYLFTKPGAKWGSHTKLREIHGATLLALNAAKQWVAVAGARLVLRYKPDFAAFDLCTNAAGSTWSVPERGCTIPPGEEWRLEVDALGHEGCTVLCVLHGYTGEAV